MSVQKQNRKHQNKIARRKKQVRSGKSLSASSYHLRPIPFPEPERQTAEVKAAIAKKLGLPVIEGTPVDAKVDDGR